VINFSSQAFIACVHLGLEGSIDWEEAVIVVEQFFCNSLFKGRKLARFLLVEVIEEEQVIPHVVFEFGVVHKSIAKTFKVRGVTATNETLALHRGIILALFFSELAEGVDDDTEDNVHENDGNNQKVRHVEEESRGQIVVRERIEGKCFSEPSPTHQPKT